MNKTKILASLLSLLIVGVLVLAGPANAFNFITSSIPDTNKGDDISFTIDISDIDKQVDHTTLIIENKGPSLDRIVCTIQNDGSFECIRYKGSLNNPKPYSDVEITQTGDFGFGYGYGTDVSFDVVWHTGVDHQPGTYSAHVDVSATDDSIASSPEKTFKLITPAKPKK